MYVGSGLLLRNHPVAFGATPPRKGGRSRTAAPGAARSSPAVAPNIDRHLPSAYGTERSFGGSRTTLTLPSLQAMGRMGCGGAKALQEGERTPIRRAGMGCDARLTSVGGAVTETFPSRRRFARRILSLLRSEEFGYRNGKRRYRRNACSSLGRDPARSIASGSSVQDRAQRKGKD